MDEGPAAGDVNFYQPHPNNRRPPGPGRQAGGRAIQAKTWVFTLWRDEPPLGWAQPPGEAPRMVLDREFDFFGLGDLQRPDDEREPDEEPEPEVFDEQEPEAEAPVGRDFEQENPPRLPEHLDFIVYQQEQGRRQAENQNRLHWQGYLEFDKRMTLAEVLRAMDWKGNECHLEPRMGTQQQAINYVTKEDTRVGDSTREWGQKHDQDVVGGWQAAVEDVKNGASWTDMVEAHTRIAIQCHSGVQKAILALTSTPSWRKVETFVFWGATGTGKTRGVYEREGHLNVYAKMASRSGSVQWFDGYNGERALLLDEFRCQYDLQELLRWLDGHPLRVEVKGAQTIARWSRVYICSNVNPATWYAQATQLERAALWRRIPEDHIFELPHDAVPPLVCDSTDQSVARVAPSFSREASQMFTSPHSEMGPPSVAQSSSNNSVCRSRDSVQRTPWITL